MITTPEDATVTAGYKPSTAWDNTFLPFPMATVTSVKVDDGRGQAATTGYSYAGGRYHPSSRKFLGFKTVTKTLPKFSYETAAPTVTTTYRQDYASIGLPSTIVTTDGAGDEVEKITEGYAVVTSRKPYVAENTSTTVVKTVGGNARTLKTERTFDDYGNVLTETAHGRTDVPGDEILTRRGFAKNLSAYIVSLPYYEYAHRGTTTTDPYAKQHRYYYDGAALTAAPVKGNLTAESDSTGSKWLTRTYENDGYGNRVSALEPENITVAWTYDPQFRLYPIKKTVEGSEVWAADYAGNEACEAPVKTRGMNLVWFEYTYDVFCRQTSRENTVTGSYVQTAYAGFGDAGTQRIVTKTSRPNYTTPVERSQYFDGRGRVWRVVDKGDSSSSLTAQTDTIHDARNNLSKVSHPYVDGESVYWTTTTYDWAGRPLKTVNPDGSAKTYGYYAQESLQNTNNIPILRTSVTDEEGLETLTYTSTWGDIIALTQRATLEGGTTSSHALYRATYDPFHRLTYLRDAGGSEWNYTYDLVGNRLSSDDPDLGKWTYAYDERNRLILQKDARGKETTITYDKFDQVWTRKIGTLVLEDNDYHQSVAGYYNRGRLTTATNPNATIKYDYNADGLLARKTMTIDGETHIENVYYDKGQQPLYKTYQRGSSAAAVDLSVGTAASPWVYNLKGQLLRIPGYITGIDYEPDGQTKQISYQNGTVTMFTYSPSRRWLTKVHTVKRTVEGEATTDANIVYSSFARDNTGRITKLATDPGYNFVYSYDLWGQLLEAYNATPSQVETFTYASNGNMTSKTGVGYVYPAATAARPHAPISVGGDAISYDLNGNMLSYGGRTYDWDDANRLSSVTDTSGSTVSTVSFAYGPDGQRVKKSSPFGETLYPDANVEIRPAAVTGEAAYVRYPHPDIKIDGAGTFFLHRDNRASLRALTNSEGAIVEQTRYRAYGEPTISTMTTEKGYIGERRDAETGLMYLNARYMDPKLGRFIPRDSGEAK